MAVLRSVAGAVGSAINKLPGGSGSLFGNKAIDISATLQNWGGNTAGSLKSAIVKPAYASSGQVLGASSLPQSTQRNASYYTPTTSAYTPPKTTNVTQKAPSGGAQSTGQQAPEFDFSMPSPDEGFGGGPSEQDMINEQFNQFSGFLDQQEGQSKANFAETQGLYDTMKTNALNQYNTEKTQQTEGIKKTENLNLAKVRQLLGELNQRNAAYAALGGTGSASEAMAERFGREAQSRMGNVMDQTQQAIQRVNTFYDNAVSKLNESYQANVLNAKQSLDENLSNIQQQRMASASAKQQGIMNAWKDYYNNVNQAKLQAQTFKAQYDIWKQQQDNSLGATQGFNAANQDTMNTGMESSYAMNEQASQPTTQSNALNPYYRVLPKKQNYEDLLYGGLNNILDQAGMQ